MYQYLIRSGWCFIIGMTIVMAFGLHGAAAQPSPAPVSAAPVARIVAMDLNGMAPFTLHVHGLNSTVSDDMQARYEWDFGDPGSGYNKLDGWNAAHLYRQPGTYTVRLRVTDASGQSAVVTRKVKVAADTRRRIYVSPSGNDSNDGSINAPLRSPGRAKQLMGDDTAVLFQRGGQYDISSPFHIEASNVVVGAYGSGNPPKFMWVGNIQYAGMITMWWWARDVVVQDIEFDSHSVPTNEIVRGTQPHGNNITVTRCTFDRVSYAMNTEFGVNGFLALDNTAGHIGAYFIWAIGNDHVYLGNTVADDADEHTIRLGNARRVLIAHNDLRNTAKSTVWAMLGDHCYIAHNTLRDGRVLIGPNFADGGSSQRFHQCVADGNLILDEGFVIYSGAEDVMLRNNVIRANNRDAISIWGWYGPMNRTTRDVKVFNNTAINDGTEFGCFLRLGDGSENLKVMNNLYVAPDLNTHNNAANVYSSDNSLSGQSFRNNIWSLSSTSNWVNFMSGGTGVGEQQWDGYSETLNEWFHDFDGSELDADYRPQFGAKRGRPLPGVQTDFYGKKRPKTGKRSVGAVEMN